MLLLALETQRKMRHAATNRQHGIDESPHLEESRSQSLSRGGIKILEPDGWKDASERRDQAYQTLRLCLHARGGGRTVSRCSKGLTSPEIEPARIWCTGRILEFPSCLAILDGRDGEVRWDCTAGCFVDTQTALTPPQWTCGPSSPFPGYTTFTPHWTFSGCHGLNRASIIAQGGEGGSVSLEEFCILHARERHVLLIGSLWTR